MTTLITNSQFKQFDEDGKPLAGGFIHTYIVGTTTDKVTYQDQDKVAAHDNPVELDSWGETTIWIDGDTKFVVKDSDGVEIRTYPNFADASSAEGESPVNPSPDGAVLRSTDTETGYIKIQLPMGEWPNAKILFDLMVYTDGQDESFKMTLGGYADSNTTAWLTTTASTNGKDAYDVQFGHDGTYPCIYIGAVDSEWIKPQIAIVNFLAGEFSYGWTTWDNGWVISVTTSIGTITSTPSLIRIPDFASEAETITGTSETLMTNPLGVKAAIDNLTGDWQDISFNTDWSIFSTVPARYRLLENESSLQIYATIKKTNSAGSPIAFTLPAGFRPAYQTGYQTGKILHGNWGADTDTFLKCLISTNGEVSIGRSGAGEEISTCFLNFTLAIEGE